MSGAVSLIIPVLNEQGAVATLLQDLRERYPDSELIVVDGGSNDQTVALAMPLCDQLLMGEAGRAAQMNLGGQLARGPYLFFLHADSRPTISAAALEEVIRSNPQWGFSRIRLGGEAFAYRVIEWFINHRSRLTSIGTGDQMLFLQQSLFDSCGGFDAIPLMEDVALCKRLRESCAPLILTQQVVTSTRRWERGGIARTVLRMWALRFAYYFGASPQTLHRHYYGQ
jgi:rSAM/selenodomain-associated transferase 2